MMEEKNTANTNPNGGREYFSDSHGTGVVSSLVFIVVAIVVMLIVSHFIN